MKRRLFSILGGLAIITYSNAQFTVLLNDQPAKQNTEYNLKEVKNLNVSFKNATEIPEYTSGRATIYVSIVTASGTFINIWKYQVDGYKASNNFLYPKTPVTYSVWSNTSTATDLMPDYYDASIPKIIDKYGDIDYRKFKVTIGLTFEESISWDKYGKAQVLLTPFTFNLDLWGNSNTLEIGSAEVKYNYNESSNYKSFSSSTNGDEIKGLGLDEYFQIKFTNFSAELRVIPIDGSQDDALNNLKSHFEGYLNYQANQCNGKKILKNIPVPDDSRDWKTLTSIGSDGLFVDLDQKNNSNFSSVKVFEPVSFGSISGYKFKGMRYTNECVTTSMIVATVESPADPKKRSLKGSNIIYILKHPGNSKKLLLFHFKSNDRENSNISALSPMENDMEQFLSALSIK
jgi:hypothetical protein